jgi:hypothetical protein
MGRPHRVRRRRRRSPQTEQADLFAPAVNGSDTMKRKWIVSGLLLLGCGCSTTSHTTDGAAVGGAAGAVAGGLIGAAAHAPVAGALIGGGIGAVTGAAVGNAEDRREDRAARQAAAVAAQRALSLEDIVGMVQNHVSDGLIINQIRQSSTLYNLTGEQIVWLKQQGVSDAVIMEMQAHSRQVIYTQPSTTVIYREPAPVAVGVGFCGGRRW